MTRPLLTDTGFPPEGRIFDVSSFRLRVLEGPHPWAAANMAEIDRNWEREVQANPHLFNGSIVFQRDLTFGEGHVEGAAHIVPYAAFLHWRRHGRAGGGYHLFAMPMILSSDGALMAVRMAETTANPGRVYSPAGSLDIHDIRDGLCDIEGNMRRETMEETGLDLADMESEPRYHAVHTASSVAIFRVFRSQFSEAEMGEHVRRHIETEEQPEIAALVGIRSPDPSAHDYVPFMLPVLEWIFGTGAESI